MARTVYKNKMDSFFPTSLALDELEFSSLAACGELTNFDNDDVFSNVLKGSPVATEFSPQDLLDELDFQDGSSFMDVGWMTEKVDLSDTGAALSTEETITDLSAILNIDLPLTDTTLFETPQQNFTTVATVGSEKDAPRSPEQKVPDFLMSLVGVASPGSVSSVDSGVLSPSPPSSPYHSNETGLPSNVQQAKQHQTPYSRSPQSPGVKPRVKTPEQKERKRTQNKDAATRYRIKKRDEQGTLFTELDGLEKTNTELKEQVASLSKEIEYLKNLMLEVCKVKLQKQAQSVQCS